MRKTLNGEEVAMGVEECVLMTNNLIVFVPAFNGSSFFQRGLGVEFEFKTPEGQIVTIPVGSTVKVVPVREE